MRMVCTPDCPDRCPDPNCHMTCEKYLEAVKEHQAIRAIKDKERIAKKLTIDHERKLHHYGFSTKLR